MRRNKNGIPILGRDAKCAFGSKEYYFEENPPEHSEPDEIPPQRYVAGEDPLKIRKSAEYWNVTLEDLYKAINENVTCVIDKMPGYYGPEKFTPYILFEPMHMSFRLTNFYLNGEVKKSFEYYVSSRVGCFFEDMTEKQKNLKLAGLVPAP